MLKIRGRPAVVPTLNKILGAILCVATVYVAAACQQKREEAPSPAAPSSRPVKLAAAIGGRLAVLGSADGSASYIPGQVINVSSMAVTADARSLIITNLPRDCKARWYQPEVDQVDITTGAQERVVGGSEFPAVNAKGMVAYGIVCDGQTLGFTDLVTGGNFRSHELGASLSESSTIESVRPLAWLSDGRTLFYEASVRGEAYPRYYFGRVWPLVLSNEQVVRRVGAALRETGPAPTAAALVNDKTVAFAQDYSGGSQVREWDVSTESFLRADRGFRLPETITTLKADPSGTHFLAVTRSHALYRWSVGDRAPAKLADGVSAAVWLP